jgi:hypothetical protein
VPRIGKIGAHIPRVVQVSWASSEVPYKSDFANYVVIPDRLKGSLFFGKDVDWENSRSRRRVFLSENLTSRVKTG